jgi:hypothetical protein
MAEKLQKKGQEGTKTGGKVRGLIADLQKSGLTLVQIGKLSNRSPSTLSQILDGTIKNPPNSLVSRLESALKSRKKR